MNNKFLAFLILLSVSLVACNKENTNSTTHSKETSYTGKIAYVNTDTIMEKYQFAIDLNEEFTKKQENMTADLNVKAKKVEDMIKSFQYRLQNNGFASRERAEQEQQRIQKKRQELIELDETLKAEIAKDFQQMTGRLQDSIMAALEDFNKEAGYDLILRTTTNGNVLLAKPELDITNILVEKLNSAYKTKSNDANTSPKKEN